MLVKLNSNEVVEETAIAKKDGTTIKQHADKLIENCDLLYKTNYLQEDESFWRLLKIAAKYHDYGKANVHFQNKLLNNPNNEILFHHLISPLFFLDSVEAKTLSDEEIIFVINAIIRHHSRQQDLFSISNNFENKSLQEALLSVKDTLLKELDNYERLVKKYLLAVANYKRILKKDERKMILLTGLLIRLDHSASAELDVEEELINHDREQLFKSYINNQPLRLFQEKFKDKYNVCVVADTGLGKTGLSVLWSKRKKFYVLPNRTSTNAMYKTLASIYGLTKVGLLHSTSLYYLFDERKRDSGVDLDIIEDYEKMRILSKPVTVCTADQLFLASFKYHGYEKIYATLAYSDVVIDEIQSFSPQQIVPILRQIQDTINIGARYLIITATLPDIVAERLSSIGVEVITNDKTTIDSIKRHRVKIHKDKSITDLAKEIISEFRANKKVLVIVNTVNTATKVYQEIEKQLSLEETNRLHLLHSRFTWLDRLKKEVQIKSDSLSNLGAIWVCTQIVEVSLDIDFDCLFTEIATCDAIVQRIGRIWRHRHYDYQGKHNVNIACNVNEKAVSFIYERCLREKTVELIEQLLTKDDFLLSEQKRRIVKELYSRQNLTSLNSSYLKNWAEVENILNSGWDFFMKDKAQETFRDVLTVEVIHSSHRQKVESLCKELDSDLRGKEKKIKRINVLKQIQLYKIPVPVYFLKNSRYVFLDKYNIIILDGNFTYSSKTGIEIKSDYNDFEERCL